ncbi:MAG: Apolipoprotein N-acyltransferase [Gammaproteobacteria bacterium]|nr:Apolipoprotein N-acyltransferase [Gammaproteobacteria bacterium]
MNPEPQSVSNTEPRQPQGVGAKTVKSSPIQLLAALGAGCIAVLGFGPFGYFWATLLSASVLVWLWWDATTRRAVWLGFVYGAGMFGTGVSWVYVSMYVYGGMPPWMAVLVVIVFVALLSLYPALVGWIYRAFLVRQPSIGALAGLPALWAVSEWVRGWAFSGFPWLSLGYSQADSWLSGWSPVLGVYGVSWLLMLTAVLLVAILKYHGRLRWYAATVIAVVWLGGLALNQVRWAELSGGPLDVALVQGNVSLDRKWAVDQRPAIMNHYLNLTNNLEDRDLIIWPESALPYYIREVADRIWLSMRRHPADFILGLLERASDRNRVYTFNSVVSITGNDPQIYRKTHLVPFGEYLPLEPLLGWIINYLHIPMSDFTAWKDAGQGSVRAAGTDIGVTICYEDAFPAELMKSLPEAKLLINVSEDAWFGDSLAPHQRIQMARMRAMETARPMLRAANTGVSAIIDHRGTVTVKSSQFVTAVVEGSVQPMQGTTLYVFWGNGAVLGIAGILLLLSLPLGFRSKP